MIGGTRAALAPRHSHAPLPQVSGRSLAPFMEPEEGHVVRRKWWSRAKLGNVEVVTGRRRSQDPHQPWYVGEE